MILVCRLRVSEKEIIWLVLETKMSSETPKMKWSPRSWKLRTTSGLLLLPLSRLGRNQRAVKVKVNVIIPLCGLPQ